LFIKTRQLKELKTQAEDNHHIVPTTPTVGLD